MLDLKVDLMSGQVERVDVIIPDYICNDFIRFYDKGEKIISDGNFMLNELWSMSSN